MRDDIDFNYFKKKLTERQSELTTDQDKQRRESAPKKLDQSRVGRLSRMDAMQQQAMSQAAERRINIELQQIKMALERLDSGEYGYCILCDEEIAQKRLEFDPSIPTCIECAQRSENS